MRPCRGFHCRLWLAKCWLARLFHCKPMTQSETIVCKPTSWFLLRAAAMLAMFSVFAVMFFLDGSTGYRKKNQTFYLNQTFRLASEEFKKMNDKGTLTPAEWKNYAQSQSVAFPKDASLLPADLTQPMPWPAILQDYDRMKPLNWNLLWKDYTSEKGLNIEAPEEPFSAQKIREQWIVMYFCLTFVAITAFFLIRTLGRSIQADGEGITTQAGIRIPYAEMKRLDLRKWDTKGLGFIDFEGVSGKGKARIDGMTYGGFKKEQGEPAEQLMQAIRSHFSGEIIEYASVGEAEKQDSDSATA